MELIQSNPTLQKNSASKLHKEERKLTSSRTYVADIFAGSQWTVRRMSNPAMRFWAWTPLPLPRKSGRPGRFSASCVGSLQLATVSVPTASRFKLTIFPVHLNIFDAKTFEELPKLPFHISPLPSLPSQHNIPNQRWTAARPTASWP